MKKVTVDCQTGPRSRIRARGTSLISQRNSFRPLEMRVLPEGLGATEGPGLGTPARDVPVEAAPVLAGRALAVQFIGDSIRSRRWRRRSQAPSLRAWPGWLEKIHGIARPEGSSPLYRGAWRRRLWQFAES